MRRLALGLGVLASLSISTLVVAQAPVSNFFKTLGGGSEVPSVSTSAKGSFVALISSDGSRIDWALRYTALEGDVQQSHIHIGNVGVNGGISVFLCTNLGNGPAGQQGCPPGPATISGVITAADVSPNIAATAAARTQGLNTGEIDELIAALRGGYAYVNVHSTTWPGGEIRSQIDSIPATVR